MRRGSPVLNNSSGPTTSFSTNRHHLPSQFPADHPRSLKRARTVPTFKPPPRLSATLPRFLSKCPSGHDLVVKYVNILVVRRGQLVKDELWVHYVNIHQPSKPSSSSSSAPSSASSSASPSPITTTTTKSSDPLSKHKIGSWVIGTILCPEHRFWNAVRRRDGTNHKPDYVVDGGGSLVSSGFIDIQLNGAFGIDFTSVDITEEQVHKVSEGILSHGVTSYLPTVITSSHDTYCHAIPTIAAAGKNPTTAGANILGLHLEGPFIHPMKKGAHPIEHITSPELGMKTIRNVYGHLEMVRVVTLAPELPGSFSSISGLNTMGVCVAVGHTTTSLSTAVSAVQHGARLVTHLFNAMSAFHHRDPGLVGILTSTCADKIHYGIIVDGIHVHPSAVKMAYESHPMGAILVTDAMCALGLPPGRHMLGKLEVDVIVQGGHYFQSTCTTSSCKTSSTTSFHKMTGGNRMKAVLASDHDTLAGSVASMDECVRNYKAFTGCSVVEALAAASIHPAMALGIDQHKGSLMPGRDADMVFLNPKTLSVRATFVSGVLSYASTKEWEEQLSIF